MNVKRPIIDKQTVFINKFLRALRVSGISLHAPRHIYQTDSQTTLEIDNMAFNAHLHCLQLSSQREVLKPQDLGRWLILRLPDSSSNAV